MAGDLSLTCILGIVGAVVGGWLATMFALAAVSAALICTSALVAVVGAIVVLVIFRLLRRLTAAKSFKR